MQHGEGQKQAETAGLAEFMSVAAHDLRNPIAVVRASAQMAQRHVTRGDVISAQTRLKAIVDQTDRLADILEAFVDAARVTVGQVPLRRERIDLVELVNAAAERARGAVGELGDRQLECEIPNGCIGTWDGPAIERAIRALVTNALLYGDPSAPVRIEAVCAGNRVRLTVSGGGPGPDVEETAHLFQPFYRGRSAANAGVSGSGLGLFTARGIAQSHAGNLRQVEGDRFEMELPLIDEVSHRDMR